MEVILIDVMGNESSIVQAARVSYGGGTKSVSEDKALIRYLMRHWHTTPFEMVEFKFRIKCPIFVARQLLRHRTASVNELSARYSVVREEFWSPKILRKQGTTNTQGSGEEFEDDKLLELYTKTCKEAFSAYEKLLEGGVSRELARCVLPLCTFTEFYWKIDLHNLLHFLRLRMDEHAQEEIRDLSGMMWKFVQEKLPNVSQAFLDFRVNSVNFSGPEIRGEPLSKGEQREFDAKVIPQSRMQQGPH